MQNRLNVLTRDLHGLRYRPNNLSDPLALSFSSFADMHHRAHLDMHVALIEPLSPALIRWTTPIGTWPPHLVTGSLFFWLLDVDQTIQFDGLLSASIGPRLPWFASRISERTGSQIPIKSVKCSDLHRTMPERATLFSPMRPTREPLRPLWTKLMIPLPDLTSHAHFQWAASIHFIFFV